MTALEHVFVYDGDCGICTRFANMVRERTSEVSVVAWQAVSDLAELDLTRTDVERAAAYRSDRTTVQGHHAIGQVLQRCGSWRRLAGIFISFRLLA